MLHEPRVGENTPRCICEVEVGRKRSRCLRQVEAVFSLALSTGGLKKAFMLTYACSFLFKYCSNLIATQIMLAIRCCARTCHAFSVFILNNSFVSWLNINISLKMPGPLPFNTVLFRMIAAVSINESELLNKIKKKSNN